MGLVWEDLDLRMLLGDGDDGGVGWTSAVTSTVLQMHFNLRQFKATKTCPQLTQARPGHAALASAPGEQG